MTSVRKKSIRKSKIRKRSKSKIRKSKSKIRKSKSKIRGSINRNSNEIILQKSTNPSKKYMVIIGTKTVHFGAKGYSDYTVHKDNYRMKRYQNRHKSRENWKKSGIKSAGFWAKWILWNKPSLRASIKDTERRFGLKIRLRN